jgi:GT2 family glycosyltransferase
VEIEVLIPTVDGAERLREVLGSLRAQTLRPAVCVIDNGSAEPTRKVIAEFEKVRAVRSERNLGFGAALNLGVRDSRAELLVFLNDDAVAEPTFIERLAAARAASGAEMIAGCLVRPDGLIDSGGVEIDRSLIGYDLFHGEPYGRPEHRGRAPLAPSGGAAAYDRDAFADVGGFDESFFAYLEDVELGIRMSAAGMRCAAAYDAVAWHRHSATLGSGSSRKNVLMGRSRGYLLRKYRDQLSLGDRLRGGLIDAVTYAGQIAIDRNAGALRGRLAARGLRPGSPWNESVELSTVPRREIGAAAALRVRLGRRRAG